MAVKKCFRIFLSLCLILAILIPAGAYYEKVHSLAAKLAIRLLKQLDQERSMYREIYLPAHTMAIGMGAWQEDFGVVRKIDRSFRHYYDPDAQGPRKGVPYYLYYELWELEGAAVEKPKHGVYEGALEWARRGTDRTGNWNPENPLNWEGAIRAYDYTANSKLEAYRRLGHVIHLLVDMSEPDHASNVPHGGSGFKLPESIDEICGPKIVETITNSNLPHIVRLQLAQVIMFASIKLKNMLTKSDTDLRTIGFEGLIEDTVQPAMVQEFFPGKHAHSNKPSEGFIPNPGPIKANQIRRMETLDHYFNFLAYESKKTVQDHDEFPLALGCMDLLEYLEVSNGKWLLDFTLSPDITLAKREARKAVDYMTNKQLYLVPVINRNSSEEKLKYYDLARNLLTTAVELSAGLMQHFHDIVNPPPYVKSVTIKQGNKTKYHAYWKDTVVPQNSEPGMDYSIVPNRVLLNETNQGLEHDKDYTISIEFGPTCEGLAEPIDPQSISVTIGEASASGNLQQTKNSTKWTGGFRTPSPSGLGLKETMAIVISAKDRHVHYDSQSQNYVMGFDLDADPKNPAKLWCQGINGYAWNNYKKGEDTNHQISIKGVTLDIEETEDPEEEPRERDDAKMVEAVEDYELFFLEPLIQKSDPASTDFIVHYYPQWKRKNSCITVFYMKEVYTDSVNPKTCYTFEGLADINKKTWSGKGVYPDNPDANWEFQNNEWYLWWVCCDEWGASKTVQSLTPNRSVLESGTYWAVCLAKDDKGNIYRAEAYFNPAEWELSPEQSEWSTNYLCRKKRKKGTE